MNFPLIMPTAFGTNPDLDLKRWRRPPNDTGVCFHGTACDNHGSDVGKQAMLAERMKRMGATWAKILDCSKDSAKALIAMGMEPVIRPYKSRPGGAAFSEFSDQMGKVTQFIDGGGRYVEAPWNEVNNNEECQNGVIPHPCKIVEQWIPFCREVLGKGGRPSTPALSQGGVWEDLAYLETFLQEIRIQAPDLFNEPIWLAVHAYCLNHPPSYKATTGYDQGRFLYPDWRSSFLGYQLVADLAFRYFGREIPVILTEGGVVIGSKDDGGFPEVTEAMHRDWCVEMVNHMRTAPKWLFGGIGFWLISNWEADHFNMAWESAAFYKVDRPMWAVAALEGTPRVNRAKVWEENPVATEQERIDAAKARLRTMFEDKVLSSNLVSGSADRIEACEAWFDADKMDVLLNALEGWGMGSAGFAITTEAIDRVSSSARGALASLQAVAKKA